MKPGWPTEAPPQLRQWWLQSPLQRKKLLPQKQSPPSPLGAVASLEASQGAVVVAKIVETAVDFVAAAELEEAEIIQTKIKIKVKTTNKDKSLTRKAQGLLQMSQTMHAPSIGRRAEMRPTVPTR